MRSPVWSWYLAALLLAVPSAALAEGRGDNAARNAIKRAQGSYRANDFDAGRAALQKALKACGTSRCSQTMRASLDRDLGVMLLKRGDRAASATSFVEALRLDSSIDLPSAYEAPEIRAEWDAARDEAGVKGARQPSGDFTHTPAPEQTVRTPLPIYVEYSGESKLTQVIAKYMPPGESEYKKLVLTKVGSGWGGTVPCADVKRGVIRYYVQGFDSTNAPMASSGEPRKPFYVTIRYATHSPPPSLPGSSPPTQCSPDGASATSSSPNETPDLSSAVSCDDDSTCKGGKCEDGHCTEPPKEKEETGEYSRIWVGVAGSLDIQLLPSGTDVCALTTRALPYNAAGYYCVNADGTDYPSRVDAAQNALLSPGNAGNVGGGPTVGAIRVMVSFDYALSSHFLAGARVGFVAHTYPGQAAGQDSRAFGPPIHLEARATYLFGDEPLAQTGLAPLVMLGGGMAQFGASADTSVNEAGAPGPQAKIAWKTSGPFFGAIGGGLRIAFSKHAAATTLLKLAGAFGSNGFAPTIAPEVGVQYGF